MVFVAGSADIRNSPSGAVGASARQPEVLTALQRPMPVTDSTFGPPGPTTYAVPVPGTSAKAPGPDTNPGFCTGAARSFGGRVPQPEVITAPQVRVSIADSVSSPALTANTVCSARSTATKAAPMPVGTVAGVRRQPEVIFPLHRAPSITDTDPSRASLAKLAV